MAEELKRHILTDRSKEQMAVTLCGFNQFKDEIRFLGRHLILLPSEAFDQQSLAFLQVSHEVQRQILRMAADEGLSQIDWHSHPGAGHCIGFSAIDDHHEEQLARYLAKKIPGTYYASVVMNDQALDARVWETNEQKIKAKSVESIRWGKLNEETPCSSRERYAVNRKKAIDEQFSRQVLAFGQGLQERLRHIRIGAIGLGGIGGILVEMLSRLGVSDWVLVDNDTVEATNLNRLPGSSQRDVYQRAFKVRLAQRNITRVDPFARIYALPISASDPRAIQALKSCDLLIVATDNHSSRLIANQLSVQYLIPLVHVGVNIEVDEGRKITDISGEYALPSLGEWCLQCAGIFDNQLAGWELADENLRAVLWQRGYIQDTPAPAVYHLNGVIASLAAAEIHNLIFPYKPVQKYLAYDELKAELISLDIHPKDDCPVCSAEGLLGLGDLEPFPDYQDKTRTVPLAQEFGPGEPPMERLPLLAESTSDFNTGFRSDHASGDSYAHKGD
jgi:molybdopterin/thiamine biosynthesis adenylyltransferase